MSEETLLTETELPPICEGCGHLMDRRDWSREANGPCVFWACDDCKTNQGLWEALQQLNKSQAENADL